MTEFQNKQERDAAARALMAPNQQKAQQPAQPSWANWFGNRFTAENAMNIPYNAYAMTSNAIGAGIKGAQYFLDPETAPHPRQRQVDPGAVRAAFDVASLAATGGIGATTVARAAGRPMVPKGAIGSNARTISAQRHIDEDIVNQKISDMDFDVQVSPVFDLDGQKFRVVLDGHHSLEAAKRNKSDINWIEQSATDNDIVSLLDKGEIEDFLLTLRNDSDYYDVLTGRDVW